MSAVLTTVVSVGEQRATLASALSCVDDEVERCRELAPLQALSSVAGRRQGARRLLERREMMLPVLQGDSPLDVLQWCELVLLRVSEALRREQAGHLAVFCDGVRDRARLARQSRKWSRS